MGLLSRQENSPHDWDLMTNGEVIPTLPFWNQVAILMQTVWLWDKDKENKLAACSNSTLFWVPIYLFIPSSFRGTHAQDIKKGRNYDTWQQSHRVPMFFSFNLLCHLYLYILFEWLLLAVIFKFCYNWCLKEKCRKLETHTLSTATEGVSIIYLLKPQLYIKL